MEISRLVDWATAHGATLGPDIEPYADPVTGLSLRARLPLRAGSPVVSCPMSITMSYLNLIGPTRHTTQFHRGAGPGRFEFPAQFINDTPPHVLSRFLLMREFLLGEDSFWHPYIGALPQPWDGSGAAASPTLLLPPCWPEEDAALLEGTNVGVAVADIRRRTRAEYGAAIVLLGQCDGDGDGRGSAGPEPRWWSRLSLPLYEWALAIYSSRSFRPSKVLPGLAAVADELPGIRDRNIDDFSILLPLLDLGNHDMQARVRWEAEPTGTACTWVTGNAYPAGAQVFNNYGSKTNAELLVAYGFMIPETDSLHNDYVHLRRRADASAPPQPPQPQSPQPSEFLVSLQPIDHPSSVLAHGRQIFNRASMGGAIFPPLAHVDDALVWELGSMALDFYSDEADQVHGLADPGVIPRMLSGRLGEPEITRSQGGDGDDHGARKDVGARDDPPLELGLEILRQKLELTLARIREHDRVVAEPSARQALALHYRAQCARVLEAALEKAGWSQAGEQSE